MTPVLPDFSAEQLGYRYRWRYADETGTGAAATDERTTALMKLAELKSDPEVSRFEFYEDGKLTHKKGAAKKLAVVLILGAVAIGGIVFAASRRK